MARVKRLSVAFARVALRIDLVRPLLVAVRPLHLIVSSSRSCRPARHGRKVRDATRHVRCRRHCCCRPSKLDARHLRGARLRVDGGRRAVHRAAAPGLSRRRLCRVRDFGRLEAFERADVAERRRRRDPLLRGRAEVLGPTASDRSRLIRHVDCRHPVLDRVHADGAALAIASLGGAGLGRGGVQCCHPLFERHNAPAARFE